MATLTVPETLVVEITTEIDAFSNTNEPSTGVKILRGVAAAGWGIDDLGPYFSPQGVPETEQAVLSVGSDGILVLQRVKSAAEAQLRAPQVFVSVMAPRPRREYDHDGDGRLLTSEQFGADAKRVYGHQETGQLFVAPPAGTPDRGYGRRPDGRLFPHPPIHAERR